MQNKIDKVQKATLEKNTCIKQTVPLFSPTVNDVVQFGEHRKDFAASKSRCQPDRADFQTTTTHLVDVKRIVLQDKFHREIITAFLFEMQKIAIFPSTFRKNALTEANQKTASKFPSAKASIAKCWSATKQMIGNDAANDNRKKVKWETK